MKIICCGCKQEKDKDLCTVDGDMLVCPDCLSKNDPYTAQKRWAEASLRAYNCQVCRDAGCSHCIAPRRRPTPDPIKGAACEQQPISKHADGNPKSAQGAKKFSLRLIPLPAQVEINRALEDGLKKYGAANWRETGVAASVYMDAALRHIMQWFDGKQERAEDSNVHNLGHAMACLAIVIDAQVAGKLIDDRPTPCQDTDTILKR